MTTNPAIAALNARLANAEEAGPADVLADAVALLREAATLYDAREQPDSAALLRRLARELTPAPVSSAVPDHTLRDRIRRAVCEAEGFMWNTELLEPDEYGEVADAVLSVLPPPADRATVLREVADWLKAWRPEFFERWAVAEQDAYEGGVDDAATELRRLAAEAQPSPETEEERADREETERDHARGDHTYCGITCEAELPTEHLRNFVIAKGYPGTKGALDELLRRAAAGVRQPDTETRYGIVQCSAATLNQPHGPHRWTPQPGMDRVRCPGACNCPHPEDEHSVYGCVDGCACEYLPPPKPAVSGRPAADASGEETGRG
ncbi:MAG: hypothetical protein HOY75_13375 [Streptomyces sp.]|nr:hypothetical protein [Streptomyces sp.]